jgi:triosephosphate isomerase
MRKKLIVANWKMYKNVHQASLLLNALEKKVEAHRDVDVVLCPNLLVLQSLSLQINRRQFKLGAQQCYWRDEGAFTGEVSASMLTGVVDYVIVGHSERRHIFHETERDIRQKVQAVLRNKMRPILCVGETANERTDGETLAVIRDQLLSGLANVTSEEISELAVAYEPVWAVGTGNIPTMRDVDQVENSVRKQIRELYGKKAADEVRFLYGGSVDADNAANFLNIDGVDGLLVGGASLNPEAFSEIVERAFEASKKEDKEKK